MMNAPAWQSQRSVPVARPYSSDHFPPDSASPTGAGNGKWMQQVEYSRMLRSMQKGSSGDFVVPSETSATPTRLSSQRNVDLDELSPGIHDLHSFDTELLPELTEELSKVDEKLKLTKNLLETKNLEIKKINDEKKASMVVQFVAEATLRRVHAAQKDDDMPPIEAIFAPLEVELKLARQEIAKLQDDNRELDRLTKSKEDVLLDAERTVEFDLAKASMVDDLQNKNQELMKQIEICQEENMIPDKMHRQKVAEVEKLSQTVRELEEAVLVVVLPTNVVRDYQRKVQEMNEERKTLDRELARTKVTTNRVDVVVINEWKDANDKVMPVRQWLDERRFMQEKYHLRLKSIER